MNGNRERSEFVRGERMIDVINSPSMAGIRAEAIGIFPATEEADDDEARTKRKLNRDDEADALSWCRSFNFNGLHHLIVLFVFVFSPRSFFFESLLFF